MKDKIFSYSKINTYELCPQKYKINYIDKIKKSHEGIEAFMGKRVHEVLDWIFIERESLGNFFSVDLLLDKYEEFWKKKWHGNIYLAMTPKKYKRKNIDKIIVYNNGVKCLVNFYNRYKPNFNKNIVETELQCDVEFNGFKFKGIIDRLDRVDNGIYEIYDYKTGKKPISFTKSISNLQLIIYQLAVESKYKDCKKIILNWYYLKTNEIISVTYSREEINDFKLKIIKKILDIKDDKNYYPRPSMLCEWCHFWEECEIQSTTNPSICLK